ncbi:MAG TPA: hypothetical protein VIL09_14495 [Microvirga sp.]
MSAGEAGAPQVDSLDPAGREAPAAEPAASVAADPPVIGTATWTVAADAEGERSGRRAALLQAVRAELDRWAPVGHARPALEAVAETSLRWIGPETRPDPDHAGGSAPRERPEAQLAVTDAAGEPRLRPDGLPMTLTDLVAELRQRHPNLFQGSPPEPVRAEPIPAGAAAIVQPDPIEVPSDPAEKPATEPSIPPVQASPAPPEPDEPALALPPVGLVPAERPTAVEDPLASSAPEAEEAPRIRYLETLPAPPPMLEPGRSSPATRRRRARTGAASHRGAEGTARAPGRLRRALAACLLFGAGVATGLVLGQFDGSGSSLAPPPQESRPPDTARATPGAPAGSVATAPPNGATTGPEAPRAEAAPQVPPTAPTLPSPTPSAPPAASVGPPASSGAPDAAPPADRTILSGVPEVMDLTTLWLQGTVVRLDGLEWRSGAPDELRRYLAGRSVTCDPVAEEDAYRCQVEGRDLSRVVLYNGGARAAPDASPELKEAERRAQEARVGVWANP